MIKKFLYFILFVLMVSCHTNPQPVKDIAEDDNIIEDVVPKKQDSISQSNITAGMVSPDSSLTNQFKSYKIFSLTDTIKADLNGDGNIDCAFLSTDDDKKMIVIVDGKTKKQLIVGSDKSFDDMGNDFSWIDSWGTTNDKETFEIVIKDGDIVGERKVKLNNTSIFVQKEETGGGVITFKNNAYVWVHQSD